MSSRLWLLLTLTIPVAGHYYYEGNSLPENPAPAKGKVKVAKRYSWTGRIGNITT